MRNGFSLIELTIATAVIAILASIAIPQYQKYTLRTHVTTEYSAVKQPLEQAIQEYISIHGSLPGPGFIDLASQGFAQLNGDQHTTSSLATKHFSSVLWNGSHIILQFSNDHKHPTLQGKTIEIEAANNKQAVVFQVSGGTLSRQFLP